MFKYVIELLRSWQSIRAENRFMNEVARAAKKLVRGGTITFKEPREWSEFEMDGRYKVIKLIRGSSGNKGAIVILETKTGKVYGVKNAPEKYKVIGKVLK